MTQEESRSEEIKAEVVEIKNRFDKTVWVTCPLCREEWTKLRPCGYFSGGKNLETHVCVSCAESVQSINEIFRITPPHTENNLKIEIKLRKPYDTTRLPNYPAKAYAADILLGNHNFFVLNDDPHHIVVYHQNVNAKNIFDNIFQAVGFMKTRPQVKETPPKKWGKE